MQKIVVATSAFGSQDVLQNGQEYYIPVIAGAGAYGVEIRRELMHNVNDSLVAIQQALEQYPLSVVYSAPLAIWQETGACNLEYLQTVTDEAKKLGARIVKFCLGGFNPEQSDLSTFKPWVAQSGFDTDSFQLTVENDQTGYGGRIEPLFAFLRACQIHGIPVGMTFDIGNWHWSGEDPLCAARVLRDYVTYVHCKHVIRKDGKLVTVPLPEEQNAAWYSLLSLFPEELPKAIEFPLVADDLRYVTAQYVELIQRANKKQLKV